MAVDELCASIEGVAGGDGRPRLVFVGRRRRGASNEGPVDRASVEPAWLQWPIHFPSGVQDEARRFPPSGEFVTYHRYAVLADKRDGLSLLIDNGFTRLLRRKPGPFTAGMKPIPSFGPRSGPL